MLLIISENCKTFIHSKYTRYTRYTRCTVGVCGWGATLKSYYSTQQHQANKGVVLYTVGG